MLLIAEFGSPTSNYSGAKAGKDLAVVIRGLFGLHGNLHPNQLEGGKNLRRPDASGINMTHIISSHILLVRSHSCNYS